MAEHIWTILCDKVLTDPSSNKVSLIDVVERLTLHVPEAGSVEKLVSEAQAGGDKGILIPTTLQLVSHWIRSEGSEPELAKFLYRLLGPSGADIHQESFDIDLRDVASQRTSVKFRELPVSGVGRYWMVINVEAARQGSKQTKWRAVARLPLDVTESTLPPA